MIAIIVAMDHERIIGYKGRLPWHCEQDLRHFHERTMGHHLLMGRKTFEGLKSPLKKRTIHIATQHNFHSPCDHVYTCQNIHAFLQAWKRKKECLYVCGGAQIYEQAFPYADEIWLSIIDGEHIGDTYLPAFDFSHFQNVSIHKQEGFTLYHYHNDL